MATHPDKSLILFPKSVDYYQVKLTRMLEAEQYQEAVELLEFLTQCSGSNDQEYKEWGTLLAWLTSQFEQERHHVEEADVGEADEGVFLQDYVSGKLQRDNEYIPKLLAMLEPGEATEKTIMALEQLGYVTHTPEIEQRIRDWVMDAGLPPHVQIRGLQTLRRLGVTGTIELQRKGPVDQLVSMQIENTPLTFEEYPQELKLVLEHVRQVSEINHPALSYFAEQMWKEFIAYLYGSPSYERLVQVAGEHSVACAAALHEASLEVMNGGSEPVDASAQYKLDPFEARMSNETKQMLKVFFIEGFQSI